MSELRDILMCQLVERLESCREQIVANMQSKNINASGRTTASIKVVARPDGAALVKVDGANAPMATLEVGREGGNVPAGFYRIIRQWSMDKGLSFSTERERNTFAYFTARKIAREGTRRHYENEDVYSTAVNECADDVARIWTDFVQRQIKTHIFER